MSTPEKKPPRTYRATGTPLTLKQTRFIKHFIESGDATKAAQKAYPNAVSHNAIASENLSKPTVISEIERRLEAQGLDLDVVLRTHKRNITQDKDLSVSQRAIDSYYKVTGRYNNEQAPQRVQFIINT